MKNAQLGYIIEEILRIGETGELACITVGGTSKSIQITLGTDNKASDLDDKQGMNAIADWLTLYPRGEGVVIDMRDTFSTEPRINEPRLKRGRA